MAIVRTNSAHYSGMASALRSLHDGEEKYTPAQIAEYLATQGTELKPENIAKDVTIFGVTGTMEFGTGWPDDIPPEPVIDEIVINQYPDAAGADKMLLLDDKGNVTFGYMYNTPITGWYNYNGTVLPPLPELSGDSYKAIVVIRGESGEVTKATLYCSGSELHYSDPYFRQLGNAENSPAHVRYTYTSETGVWSEAKNFSTRLLFYLEDGEKLVWASHALKDWTTASPSITFPKSPDPTVSPFAITCYSYKTTDFRAIGWLRVAYHTTGEHAGQVTIDDFRTTESGGWNYIKNVRWCTRESLEYGSTSVWPKGPEMGEYNGHTLPRFFFDGDGTKKAIVKETYGYVLYDFRVEVAVSTGALGARIYNADGIGLDISHQRFYYSALSGELLLEQGNRGRTDSITYVFLGAGGKNLIWTNFDLLNMGDGSVFRAASDPPVVVHRPDFV